MCCDRNHVQVAEEATAEEAKEEEVKVEAKAAKAVERKVEEAKDILWLCNFQTHRSDTFRIHRRCIQVHHQRLHLGSLNRSSNILLDLRK